MWIILCRIYGGDGSQSAGAGDYLDQTLMTRLRNMKVEKIEHNDVGALEKEGLIPLIPNGQIDVNCDKTGPRKAKFTLWVGHRYRQIKN